MKMIEKAEVGSIACFNKYEIQALQIQMMVHIICYEIIWLLIYYYLRFAHEAIRK